MKPFVLASFALVVLAACRPSYDTSYSVDVAQPAYPTSHPRVLFDESRDDSQLVFSRQNGLLADHAITRGVRRVMTFTGESVRGGTPLLRLADSAVNRPAKPRVTRSGGDTRVEVVYGDPQPARGWSQGVALEHGRGRVVVLAEAAMLS